MKPETKDNLVLFFAELGAFICFSLMVVLLMTLCGFQWV